MKIKKKDNDHRVKMWKQINCKTDMEIWTKRNGEKRTKKKKLVRRAITRISKEMKQKNTHHNWEMWYKNKVILKIRYSSCHRLLWVQKKYAICVLLLDRFMRITDSLMKHIVLFLQMQKKSTFAKIQFTLWMAVQTTYLIWRKKNSNFLVIFFLVNKPVYRIR